MAQCEQHQQANRIAQDDPDSLDVCLCCGFQVENKQIGLFCHLSSLKYFGVGVSQYYYLLRFCGILSVLIILPYLYAMKANYEGGRCQTLDTEVYASCFWLSFSVKNLQSFEQSSYMIYVNMACVFIVMVSLVRYRYKDKERQKAMDRGVNSPSDYTIMVSKIPHDFDDEALFHHLEHYFQENLKINKNIQDEHYINKIVFAHKISKYSELNDKKKSLLLTMSKSEVQMSRSGKHFGQEKQESELSQVE